MLAMFLMLQVAAMGAEAPTEKDILFQNGVEATAKLQACMRVSALMLSKGRDSADIVARAVRISCRKEEEAYTAALVEMSEYGHVPTHSGRESLRAVARDLVNGFERETLLHIVEIRSR